MTSTTAVPPTKQAPHHQHQHHHDVIEEMRLDALDGMADRENGRVRPDPTIDELYLDDPKNLFDEERAERRQARADKLRQKLEGRFAAAVYRDIVCRAKGVTHGMFRVLVALISFSTNLTNVFPSRKQLLTRVGGSIRTRAALNKILNQLAAGGWIQRVTLKESQRVAPETSMDDGLLEEPNCTGRFISAVGVVFCIPPNVLAPGDPGWEAKPVFNHRVWGQRRNLREQKRLDRGDATSHR